MQDIASFSDLLSQLSPFAQMPLAGTPQQADPEAADSAPRPQASVPAIQSNLPGATFDSAGTSPAEQAGIYQPPAGALQQRVGMAFDFQLNLSMSRQTDLRSQQADTGSASRSDLTARRQSSLSYQSLQALHRNSAGGTFREVRAFQARMFRSQTRHLSANLDPEQGQRLDSTAQTVSRTFELNIKLNVSFLGQFVRQADRISGMDGDLLNQYLDGTDRSAGISADAVQAFFDQVDGIMADTRSMVEDTLSGFFQDVADSFGLSDQEVGALQDLVNREVSAMFDDVDRFLQDARTAMAGPASGRALPDTAAVAESPAISQSAESDPHVA